MGDSKNTDPVNTFKWTSFAEQISRLDTGAVSARLRLTDDTDEATYFFAAINQWNQKDYGDEYRAFLDDIPYGELATYAQLLHYKDDIFEALNDHLNRENSKALLALLDISVAFVRDLKDDFYQYLWTLFDTVITIIENNRESIEILDASFKALANLFQIHWKPVTKNLRKAFVRFSPLLTGNLHYLRRFAAEAFSFLLRKSSSIPKLCQFLYEQATESEGGNLKGGIAQLLFNGIRGVHKQFHSRTDELLTDFIQSALVLDNQLVKDNAMDILVEVMDLCCQWTNSAHSKSITTILLRILSEQLESKSPEQNIKFLANCLVVWVRVKKGKLFLQSDDLVPLLKAISTNEELDGLDGTFLDLLSSTLNTYSAVHSDPGTVKQIIAGSCRNQLKVVSADNVRAVSDFLESLLDLNAFDVWYAGIVARVVNRVMSFDNPNLLLPILRFFKVYTLKRRPFADEIPVDRKAFFDVSQFVELKDLVVSHINNLDAVEDELTLYSLHLYPWLLKSNETIEALPAMKTTFSKFWTQRATDEMRETLVYLLTYNLALLEPSFLKQFDLSSIHGFLTSHGVSDEVVLRSAHLALSVNSVENENALDHLEKFALLLKPNFLSPSGAIRRWSLKILLNFDAAIERIGDGEVAPESAFSLLLKAEETPADIQMYRARGNFLRRLKYSVLKPMMPKGSSSVLETVPLSILIAQLFEKFTPLWVFSHEIVDSYIADMDPAMLWSVIKESVISASERIKLNQPEKETDEYFTFIRRPKADYHGFRNEMFKLILNCAGLARKDDQFMSDILFDIYRREYVQFSVSTGKMADLRNQQDVIDEDLDDDENGEGDRANVVKKAKAGVAELKGKAIRAMKGVLNIFGKFTNPKGLKEDAKLKDLYNELLRGNCPDLQQAAMKCVLSYKYPFLKPYVEYFNALLDKDKFQDTLLKFSIDESNSEVQEADRPQLIPYLMRILHGRLLMTNLSVGRRNAIIFNYLAGLKSSELNAFLYEICGPLLNYFGMSADSVGKLNVTTMCKNIVQNYDVSNTMSLQELRSTVLRLLEIFKRLSAVLRNDQFKLLHRILLGIGILIIHGFKNSDKFAKWNFEKLKRLRIDYFDALIAFIENYHGSDLDAQVFDCFAVYVLEPTVAAKNVSSVFNFYSYLMGHPAFYPLLIKKYSKKSGNKTPLHFCFEYLNAKDCVAATRTKILDGILSMLTLSDEDFKVPMPGGWTVDESIEATFGTKVLLQFLDPIINFLRNAMPSDAADARSLPSVYLEILSHLSGYVKDVAVGDHFAKLLLVYVEKGKIRNELKLKSILQGISKLTHYVRDAKAYLDRLVKFVSTMKQPEARREMVNIVKALILHKSLESDELLVSGLTTFIELESFDQKVLDEPDYDRRHDACALLSKIFRDEKEKLDVLALSFIVRSHAFAITHIADIALRSASLNAFLDSVVYVAKVYDKNDRLFLLRKHFIKIITNGLNSPNELIRDDSVKALNLLVIHYSEDESSLKPLKQLKDEDLEEDFFENVTYIQVHKRIKAYQKLAEQLVSGAVTLPSWSLTKYILPLVRPFLLIAESKLLPISDCCLKIFTEIMKLTRWTPYCRHLENYIVKLDQAEHSKPVVRVLTAVIEGFHFDLSSCTGEVAQYNSVVNPKKLKRRLGSKILTRVVAEKKDDVANVIESEFNEHLDEEIDKELTEQNEEPEEILGHLLSSIIPKLKKCLRPDVHAIGHKLSHQGKFEKDFEALKRVPISFATVKLLQKLPTFVLDQHLHGVVLIVLQLLASRGGDVRDAARKNLGRILQSLGVKYLPFIIEELKSVLAEGFKIHVMVYTVHQLISLMDGQLKNGDLDSCIDTIIEVCNLEQFGNLAEEKGLPKNVVEAKSNKTADTYNLLGKYISNDCLMKVIAPIKPIIEEKPNSTTINKLEVLLKAFGLGLKLNEGINSSQLLDFSYALLGDNLDEMLKQVEAHELTRNADLKEKEAGYRPKDCQLLPAEPKRMGVISKTSTKSKSAIFVEFSVNLFAELLNTRTFSTTEDDDIKKLDPFMTSILSCLRLKYQKIVSSSLKSMVALLKFKLPSIQEKQKEIVDRLFVVLSDYSSSQNIVELRVNLFKCITLMVQNYHSAILTKKRLQILLNYAEADVIDNTKQTTAFALIKAILNKVIKDEKIVQMMEYLGEISVTSSMDHVRRNSREMVLKYITLYKLNEEELEKWVNFYLQQLEYDLEGGRLSALEMIHSIMNILAKETTDKFGLLIFVKLAARIANDGSKKCVNFVLLSIRKLAESVSDKIRSELVSVALDWIKTDKEGAKIIACKAVNEFVRTIPEVLSSRLKEFINVLCRQMCEFDVKSFSENMVLAVLETMTTICQLTPFSFAKHFAGDESVGQVLEKTNEYLMCLQSKAAQLAAASFLGQLLDATSAKNISSSKECGRLKKILIEKGLLEYVYSMCFSIKNRDVEEPFIEQCIKNLVALHGFIEKDEDFEGFLMRTSVICPREFSKMPMQSLRRMAIFKLMAAVVLKTTETRALKLTETMLPYLYREMMGKSSKDTHTLKTLATEVSEIMRERIGSDKYSLLLVECGRGEQQVKKKRKETQALLAINDPEAAFAAKKARRGKVSSKKRKADAQNPYKLIKRKKQEEIRQKMDDADIEYFE